MPKPLDSKLIQAMERAYLDRVPRPSLNTLSSEFGVGFSTVKRLSSEGKWKDRRDAKDASAVEGIAKGAIAATRTRPRVDDFDVLNDAIADLSGSVAAIEAKSKEGCASALAKLLQAKRELYPPDADGLAEMAVKLGITPNDFLEALRSKWSGELQQPSESTNGGKALQKS